jgi:hypothetical protein
MTASEATASRRNFSSASGSAASGKANRSRTLTGEERWLIPMTMKGIL